MTFKSWLWIMKSRNCILSFNNRNIIFCIVCNLGNIFEQPLLQIKNSSYRHENIYFDVKHFYLISLISLYKYLQLSKLWKALRIVPIAGSIHLAKIHSFPNSLGLAVTNVAWSAHLYLIFYLSRQLNFSIFRLPGERYNLSQENVLHGWDDVHIMLTCTGHIYTEFKMAALLTWQPSNSQWTVNKGLWT